MFKLLLASATLFAAAITFAHDENDDSRTATISKTIVFKIESSSAKCVATANIDYFQRGLEAQVETVVKVKDCDTASGQYIVRASVRSDTDGKTRVLDFEESWSRTGGLPLESTRRYPIGQDVELKKVRIRKLSCTCADPAEKDEED